MIAQYALLFLIATIACISAGFEDERIGRTLLATAVCFLTVWLVWYY
jgi:hypothetical protein